MTLLLVTSDTEDLDTVTLTITTEEIPTSSFITGRYQSRISGVHTSFIAKTYDTALEAMEGHTRLVNLYINKARKLDLD